MSPASLPWLSDLLHIGLHFHRLFREHTAGPYEILEYNTALELLSRTGKKAVFRKQQRVRFLQDNVIAFQDYAWGEGEIFAEYKCAPGVVVDRYQDGDRWNVLISLRSSKQRGDVEEFNIERRVKDGFTKKAEWRQVEIRNPTRHLRMSVVFPRTRHCRKAVLVQRSNHRSCTLNSSHFHALPDGRQEVRWQTAKVPPLEVYTLKWWW